MVQKHQHSHEASTTTPLPPQEAEKSFKKFYSCTIESILTGCITAWCGNLLGIRAQSWAIVHWAELPVIQDHYTRRCQRKALKIVQDSSHPSHRLFSLLPHGKRYRSAKSRYKGLLNSIYPQAIRLLNSSSKGYQQKHDSWNQKSQIWTPDQRTNF